MRTTGTSRANVSKDILGWMPLEQEPEEKQKGDTWGHLTSSEQTSPKILLGEFFWRESLRMKILTNSQDRRSSLTPFIATERWREAIWTVTTKRKATVEDNRNLQRKRPQRYSLMIVFRARSWGARERWHLTSPEQTSPKTFFYEFLWSKSLRMKILTNSQGRRSRLTPSRAAGKLNEAN